MTLAIRLNIADVCRCAQLSSVLVFEIFDASFMLSACS